MHEYEFDDIDDDENLGGNMKQIKTQDEAAKLAAIVHIPKQRVIENTNVEVFRNISETQKVIKLQNGKQLDEVPKQIVIGDTTDRIIHIDNPNHAHY